MISPPEIQCLRLFLKLSVSVALGQPCKLGLATQKCGTDTILAFLSFIKGQEVWHSSCKKGLAAFVQSKKHCMTDCIKGNILWEVDMFVMVQHQGHIGRITQAQL